MKINRQKVGRVLRVQYFQAIPEILKYQVITKAVLYLIVLVLGALAQWAIRSTGRVAIVSNDYTFLFTTWQGIVLLAMGLAVLMFYVALDLNAQVYLSSNIILQNDDTVFRSIRQSIASMVRFTRPNGILVVLYMALVAPIVGTGLSISLTSDLYVPSFIKSVIRETPLYLWTYNILVVVLAIVGIMNIFLLHGIMLDDLSVHRASRRSMRLLRENWRDFLKETLMFTVRYVLFSIAILFLLFAVPMNTVGHFSRGNDFSRFLLIYFSLIGLIVSTLISFLWTPIYILKLTQMYYSYSYLEEEKVILPASDYRPDRFLIRFTAAFLVLLMVLAEGMNVYFDELFPRKIGTEVIAHRAGGSEGHENTIAGLETAIAAGIYGAEIDVQRTADGYYVAVHDTDFSRLLGDKRRVRDMSFREVRSLRLYATEEDPGEQVPALGELLACAKDRILLFVELKGATADRQMADDVVDIIRNMGMTDQAVILSLKYDLIDYIETNYPEMQTGFLSWATYGNKGALNCDFVALEEESATFRTILSIHYQGKKVLVWTPNDEEEQQYCLCSRADAMITDNISQALRLTEELESRSDIDRMLDAILGSMF